VHYRTHGASIYDRPAAPVPVYIAAGGPAVARYAEGAGDGFICTSGNGEQLYRNELLPVVADGERAAGKVAGSVDRMLEVKLSYDRDGDRALENTRFWAPLALSKEQKHDITDPVEMEAAADALPIEKGASRWIVGSAPEKVVAGIEQYVRWGITHLVFHAPGADQLRFLEQFQQDLAPLLRGLEPSCPAAAGVTDGGDRGAAGDLRCGARRRSRSSRR